MLSDQLVNQLKDCRTDKELKVTFKKDSEYGLDPYREYSIALYEEDEDSWELLETEEVSDDSEIYLKSSITELDADTDYYITIYEVSYFSNILIIGSIILAF